VRGHGGPELVGSLWIDLGQALAKALGQGGNLALHLLRGGGAGLDIRQELDQLVAALDLKVARELESPSLAHGLAEDADRILAQFQGGDVAILGGLDLFWRDRVGGRELQALLLAQLTGLLEQGRAHAVERLGKRASSLRLCAGADIVHATGLDLLHGHPTHVGDLHAS
jgi:hypothetical protein